MKQILIITLVCLAFAKLITCDDEPEAEKKAEEEDDDNMDAYNITKEEKLGFVNRWCTNDKFATSFMKALLECRDKTLTPEEVKQEEGCFSKVFGEGKSLKIVHDEEEERKFVCDTKDKSAMLDQYDEVKKCVAKDDAWRDKHRKDMKKCMRDSTEQMRAFQSMAIDFIERWCNKEEGPMTFMKGYTECREKVVTKDMMAREEVCFKKYFGENVSLKALHEEAAEREMVCGFKNKKEILRKHHMIWSCINASPEELKTYKHDFKECMAGKGLKWGDE